jgi:hypothetical protein
VHAAQRAALRTQGVVNLHKASDKVVLRELLFAEEAGKKTALIAALLQIDQIGALQGSLCKSHFILRPNPVEPAEFEIS